MLGIGGTSMSGIAAILKKYGFSIDTYTNLNSLIFDIQDYLDDNYDLELDDLEKLAISLSEMNYYQNTNK